MLINHTLFVAVMIVIGLSFTILFPVWFKRKGWKVGAGFAIGLVLGIIAMGGLGFSMDGAVYIVNSKGETKSFVLFGSTEHKTEKGKIVKIAPNNRNMFIINEMNEDMIVERVIYGTGRATSEDELVPANGTLKSTAYDLDYFVKDTPPDQIKTKAGNSIEKNWLRTYASYEKDYGSPSAAEYDDYEDYNETGEEVIE